MEMAKWLLNVNSTMSIENGYVPGSFQYTWDVQGAQKVWSIFTGHKKTTEMKWCQTTMN